MARRSASRNHQREAAVEGPPRMLIESIALALQSHLGEQAPIVHDGPRQHRRRHVDR
jgi:hypothetical protein